MDFISNSLNFNDNIVIKGLTEELSVFYIYEKFKKSTNDILILTSTLLEANTMFEKLSTYTNKVKLFPMDDFISSKTEAVSPDLELKRLEFLKNINQGNKIIVTNITGFLKKLSDISAKQSLISLKKGMTINRKELEEQIESFGYNKESIVTSTREYAVRGYILDVFLTDSERPIRIELDGNYIESIRFFDESTQISIKEIDNIKIYPAKELVTAVNSNILEYLNDATVIYYDYDQINYGLNLIQKQILDENLEKNFYFSENLIVKNKVFISFTDNKIENYPIINYFSENIINFNNDYEKLKLYILKQINISKTVIICLSKDKQIEEIKALFPSAILNNFQKNKINIFKKQINSGFVFKEFVVVSEFDISNFQEKKTKYYSSIKTGKKIKNYEELKKGDYVVHVAYGIGIYNGLASINKNGLKKDYVQILYKDNDKIYVPVEKIDALYKYTIKDGAVPRLNKLGTLTWEKTKLNTRKKISDIAEELIKLYAERSKIIGNSYKNYPEISIFDQEFIYEETIDQKKAIEDVYRDLSSKTCMDRLLCGDVGYGKTEVAFRAAFKTIVNEFQVAYLCPTTILSNQHYKNALNRFRNYPVNIKLLNRFVSKREQEATIEGLKNGTVDMVIGTHRLLSADVKFKKLGLLIVDEEQRFGVKHKEKIKSMKSDVNILTLSATPIPRTMKFAMSGLKDMSIIDTPPVNRYPVQTYVMAENDSLVKDAVYKELARKGQVYILYNNIENIERKMQKLSELCPLAKFKYAHGRMSKTELEEIMSDFIDMKFNVLICTTIIETGIDISNVNTLIVYDADRFGLSQLYQLRGRVGRSNRIAFAYLLYDKSKILNDIAIKRLKAIKEFTELGSGYKIAMRDLALRGAGDLLGSEQAGFVNSVGIDLYLKMLEEEVNKQKGIDIVEETDTEALINVETHISDNYIDDESVKIEIHKLINGIHDKETLDIIKKEIEDRFGKITENIYIYMYEELFEKLAQKYEIKEVEQTGKYIKFAFSENISSKIKGDKLLLIANNINSKFNILYQKNKVFITLYFSSLKKHFIFYIVDLLLNDFN